MPLEPLFGQFRQIIEKCFASAKGDGGCLAAALVLQIEEEPMKAGPMRAEFMSIGSSGPIRITWNGVASLWSFCQGAARLTSRIYLAQREGKTELSLDDDPELERGLNGLELSRRLLKGDIPREAASLRFWPKWAPPIVPNPLEKNDNITGMVYFTGALGWIFRHEIAHIVCDHDRRVKYTGLSGLECERESDRQATIWQKKEYKADVGRELGTTPSRSDLALDAQGISLGLGLLWVALFDSEHPYESANYPPTAERLSNCLDLLEMSEDSAASEILADLIKCWIDPEGEANPTICFETSMASCNDALVTLHRHIRSKKH